MPGRLFRPRWKPPRRGCPPRAASGFRRLPGGRTRSCRNGPIRADATAASCFACRNSLRHSPFASLPGRFSGRIAGPAALPLGGWDSAGGQPGSLVAGTVRAACELGPGAGCEGRESDGNGLEWARIRPGTDWEWARIRPERVVKGANPAGNSPEGISSAWEKAWGALVPRQWETAWSIRISARGNCPGSRSFNSFRGSSALRQFCNSAGYNPTAPQFGSAAFRWLSARQRYNLAMSHSGVCNPIVRTPAAAAANIPLMPGRQPKRCGAQQGTSQKKSKSYSI